MCIDIWPGCQMRKSPCHAAVCTLWPEVLPFSSMSSRMHYYTDSGHARWESAVSWLPNCLYHNELKKKNIHTHTHQHQISTVNRKKHAYKCRCADYLFIAGTIGKYFWTRNGARFSDRSLCIFVQWVWVGRQIFEKKKKMLWRMLAEASFMCWKYKQQKQHNVPL